MVRKTKVSFRLEKQLPCPIFFICLSTVGGGFCPRRPGVRSGRKKSILKHFVPSTIVGGFNDSAEKTNDEKCRLVLFAFQNRLS